MRTEALVDQAKFLNEKNGSDLMRYAEALLISQRNTEDTIRPKIEWLPEVEEQKRGSADIWHKWKDEVAED